jgi:predicted ATP-dependent endonuclease of OLD family
VFALDKVGAGVSETLFLLTASFGSNDSVILLDEPALNLHPAQMKALFQMLSGSPNQFLIITHSPPLLHNLLFEKGAWVVYVRRPDSKSVVCTLNPKNLWPDNELYKSSYLIDSRVFFAQHVMLVEGETDKYFLEASADAFGLSADTYEDIVISAESKSNFPRYRNLLESLAIPYVVVADGDGGNEAVFEKSAAAFGSEKDYTIIDSGTFPKKPEGRVFFFKDKVEQFMQMQDPDLFAEVEKSLVENGLTKCKPVFMHEFVTKLLIKSPCSLNKTIKPLLEYAFHVDERKPQPVSQKNV